ncbi:hypothetical protein CW304_19250 [Bacillus sp. UFRGS-B20]|nr:hypothetical protein CW304_19250 [Bacillus sp. UFRGS-B20]
MHDDLLTILYSVELLGCCTRALIGKPTVIGMVLTVKKPSKDVLHTLCYIKTKEHLRMLFSFNGSIHQYHLLVSDFNVPSL